MQIDHFMVLGNNTRQLYGLKEFVGDITTLTYQKEASILSKKLLPHRVFRVPMLAEFIAVSRGWSIHALKGHVLFAPVPCFKPRRDVYLFLDREVQNIGRGYCQGVEVLTQFLDQDAMLHGQEGRSCASGSLTMLR